MRVADEPCSDPLQECQVETGRATTKGHLREGAKRHNESPLPPLDILCMRTDLVVAKCRESRDKLIAHAVATLPKDPPFDFCRLGCSLALPPFLPLCKV